MTDADIHRLLREYKSEQSQEIRDRIVMQYRNLVESVARRFSGVAEPMEDLAQEGYIGLLSAIEGYDADKGVKFSTYATHFIIGQIKHHLRDRGKIIKEPAWLQELNQRVTRVMEALCQETGRIPTNEEIAEAMGMTEEAITEMLTSREIFKVASLDGGAEQDDENSATYDMDRVKADPVVDFQLPIEDKVVLEAALQRLKDLEQRIIQEFYFKDRSQTEIAASMGISCNYVSHILRNSTRKLKKILMTDELKEAHMELARMKRKLDEQQVIIQEQTVIDATTRLYNRFYFDNRLSEEISRASRHQYPLAALVIKLEGFRHLNRAYGTIRSEETIRYAAKIISESVRKVDIVTYFDDGVFGLILPHTGEQVRVVADRLANRMHSWLLESGLAEGKIRVQVAYGHACYPMHCVEANQLINKAFEDMNLISFKSDLATAA